MSYEMTTQELIKFLLFLIYLGQERQTLIFCCSFSFQFTVL
jgi:hypothetical protein